MILTVITAGLSYSNPNNQGFSDWISRFKTGIPLAVSCSATISAACHLIPAADHYLKPVMWGEVSPLLLSSETSGDDDTRMDIKQVSNSQPAPDIRGGRDTDAEDTGRQLLTATTNDPDRRNSGYYSFTSHEIVLPDGRQM